jgi:hypothetical protein
MNLKPRLLWILMALATSGLSLSLPSTLAQDRPKNPETKPTTPVPPVDEPEEDSVSAEFHISQIDKFLQGRPMDEILRDLHWAGNFEMATEQNGKTLAVISFDIRPTKPCRYNKTLWAVFVDDRFVKFVDMEPVNIPYPIPVGTFPALQLAAMRPRIAIENIKKQIKIMEENEPPADPVLTAIFAQARASNAEGLRRMEKENAQLRDQYNAARLKIGMTKAKVAATLKAKPVESGVLESGSFEIYGSTKIACAASSRAYHNILALYRGDRLTGIYSGMSAPSFTGSSAPDMPLSPSSKPGETRTFSGLPPLRRH